MSRHTVTETTFTCDLCGQRFADMSTLAQLHGPAKGLNFRSNSYHPGADICKPCLDRPIADLVAYFAGK